MAMICALSIYAPLPGLQELISSTTLRHPSTQRYALANDRYTRIIGCETNVVHHLLQNKLIKCQRHPEIKNETLSIDVGITPAGGMSVASLSFILACKTADVPHTKHIANLSDIDGVKEFTTPVKPIDSFSERWAKVLHKIESSSEEFKLVIVGGGAGGVELCLAMQYRLQNALQERKLDKSLLKVSLVTRGEILPTHNWGVRRIFRRIFKERDVQVLEKTPVASIKKGLVQLANGETLNFDECVWCTQVCLQSLRQLPYCYVDKRLATYRLQVHLGSEKLDFQPTQTDV